MSSLSEFHEKVSRKFADIEAKYSEHMRCGLGCHSCCKAGLSVNRSEALQILETVRTKRAELENLERENPHRGKRCSFLSAEGACQIYEVRPTICRSHGAPIQYRDPEARNLEKAERFRDACPLNFTKLSIQAISAEDILNLDTVNTLLALLNQQRFGKEEVRFPLTIAGIESSEQ